MDVPAAEHHTSANRGFDPNDDKHIREVRSGFQVTIWRDGTEHRSELISWRDDDYFGALRRAQIRRDEMLEILGPPRSPREAARIAGGSKSNLGIPGISFRTSSGARIHIDYTDPDGHRHEQSLAVGSDAGELTAKYAAQWAVGRLWRLYRDAGEKPSWTVPAAVQVVTGRLADEYERYTNQPTEAET